MPSGVYIRKPMSEATKLKIGLANSKYQVMPRCLECNKELGDMRSRVCQACAKTGEKNSMWKGDEVDYSALHEWVKNHKPKPQLCEKCGKVTDRLDCANISGKYLRDVNDFEWICRKCHMKGDGRLKRFLSSCLGLKDNRGKKNPNYKNGKYCQDGVFK